MAAKSGGKVIFMKVASTLWTPLGLKISDEIPLSGTVKEIKTNLYFSIFGENSKIQNGRHF